MNNKLTRCQEWYYAWDLTHRKSVTDDSRFTGVLSEARVDLNPHQVDAALFAFNSPFSKGAILADETGLGKTIEAGIILSQLWASNKRRIVIVVPASLRLQWSIELYEKFYLPSMIMDSKVYTSIKALDRNPLNQKSIIICSYNFCAQYAAEFKNEMWDIVVFDEAHKLRNVYKKERKQSNIIKAAFQKDKKILLTATPLQNNLKELYGLISIIDGQLFSSLESFDSQYSDVSAKDICKYGELKERVQRISHRTLRNQVREYINYTNRIPIVQNFTMSEPEKKLYALVSEYLDTAVYGIIGDMRALMTIVIKKILASSVYAISYTLGNILERLRCLRMKVEASNTTFSNIVFDVDSVLSENDGDTVNMYEASDLVQIDMEQLDLEIGQLERCLSIAHGIDTETKATGLFKALEKGFKKISELGANEKALIFTESRKTQEYLLDYLEKNGYGGEVVCFNGTNDSHMAMRIYGEWLESNNRNSHVSGNAMIDRKQALVDYFRNKAKIMIATEAGAEGINIQFCSMIINYDMPWNPQRIEQRIGRCHRYGQKFDVVVINFVNQSNYADMRVYELLSEKFRLFDNVFGSSDEVLGAFDADIDFESRVSKILRECRTDEEIRQGFDELQVELDDVIRARVKSTKVSLLENFDEEVIEKLKFRHEADHQRIDKYNRHLWRLALSVLGDNISHIDSDNYSFILSTAMRGIPSGRYSLDKGLSGSEQLRLGHPIGQYITEKAIEPFDNIYEIEFNQSDYKYRQTLLEESIGGSGWGRLYLVKSENSLDGEDVLISACITDEGEELPDEFLFKMLEVDGKKIREVYVHKGIDNSLSAIFSERLEEYRKGLELKMSRQLEYEIEKYESWESDQLQPIERDIINLNKEKERLHRLWRKEPNYQKKADLLLQEKSIKAKISRKNDELYALRDKYEAKVDQMAENLNKAVVNNIAISEVMTLRWRLV